MSAVAEPKLVLGPESAGLLMTPAEFDAIQEHEYDENYRYELINGVLVVHPIPLAAETGPNDLLGAFLYHHRVSHPQGHLLDGTLPQQYIRTKRGRRLADRVIWTRLGRVPDPRRDVPTIAAEFVSAGRRSRRRDYIEKRRAYKSAKVKEYWIIDRFQRTMTVIRFRRGKSYVKIVRENQTYQSPVLPGFDVPLARLLEAADQWSGAK